MLLFCDGTHMPLRPNDDHDQRRLGAQRVDLSGTELRAVDLSGARFRGVDLSGVVMRAAPGVPGDCDARPNLDVGLELRRGRLSTVRQVIGALTGASLASHPEPVKGPGWPQPPSYPVSECLLCILNEEWERRLYG